VGRVIGGILDHAGVPDFLGNLAEWREESDYEAQYWADHLRWVDQRAKGEVLILVDLR
jgi:hypothetical protein